MHISSLALVCLLASGTTVEAEKHVVAAAAPVQSTPMIFTNTAAPAAVTTSAPSVGFKLRDGDDVPLLFAEDISSKTAAEGDPVTFTLNEDLKVDGVTVAKAGSKAVGEVVFAHKAGMMGKAGELNIRLNYLKVGDTKVHLRGTKGKEGENARTGTVVLTVLFGPIGLIKHGHDINIKAGTPFKAYVSDDVTVVPAA